MELHDYGNRQEEMEMRVQALWLETQRRADFSTDFPAGVDWDNEDFNASVTGYRWGGEKMQVTVLALETLTNEELMGVMGHELGHIANHHNFFFSPPDKEEVADRWAGEHGFAKGLIDAFEVTRGFVPSGPSGPYKSLNDREKFLESYLPALHPTTHEHKAARA